MPIEKHGIIVDTAVEARQGESAPSVSRFASKAFSKLGFIQLDAGLYSRKRILADKK